jgi:hypothetical protein
MPRLRIQKVEERRRPVEKAHVLNRWQGRGAPARTLLSTRYDISEVLTLYPYKQEDSD